jgi:hypothetical protein
MRKIFGCVARVVRAGVGARSLVVAVVLGFAAGAVPAFADVTTAAASAASSFTSDGTTAMASVGGAIISLAGVAVLYKWIKGMFFS